MKSGLDNSRTKTDTKVAPGGRERIAGVRYLQLSCPENAHDCGSLHQDIPVEDLPKATSYDYGFSGVVADEGDGAVDVSLSQRDAQGRSLWEDHFTAHVPNHYRKWIVKNSIYKASSVFLKTGAALELKPGAVALRLSLAPEPQSATIFWTLGSCRAKPPHSRGAPQSSLNATLAVPPPPPSPIRSPRPCSSPGGNCFQKTICAASSPDIFHLSSRGPSVSGKALHKRSDVNRQRFPRQRRSP